MAIVLDGKPAHRAGVGVLERQLELLLDVAALARPTRACAAAAPSRFVAATHRAAEERVEEIGERILIPEHLPHLVFGHCPVAALSTGSRTAAAEMHVPAAELTRI